MTDKEIDEILKKFENQQYPLIPFEYQNDDYSDEYKLADKITESINFTYLIEEVKLLRLVENVKAEFNLYSLTAKGRKVLRQGGWIKYLERKEKIEIKKEKKEDFELKILEFQAKYPRLPYYIAFASVLISFLAFINSYNSDNKINPNTSEKELYILKDTLYAKPQVKEKIQDSL
ncbi:hypothetical protein [Maribacter ulvicola]|uniref:Uncharacterized protein n=1 Tax=Maribacter ulvicola TaxID=228959 RepID=A0A1N6YW21_9FLAO|nr:hypothetical protein [Maribacter ulvicola]SIR18777.1 hypothetical protein SAMN05421797_107172 [Maribacter ulvicola]